MEGIKSGKSSVLSVKKDKAKPLHSTRSPDKIPLKPSSAVTSRPPEGPFQGLANNKISDASEKS